MKRKRKRWVKTKNAEKEEKGETNDVEKEDKGKNEECGKGRKRENEGCGKGRKRGNEGCGKHGKEEEKIGEGRKNNGLEALLTEKLYLCVQICACWHKNNEKPILNNLEKKKPMNYKNDDKQPEQAFLKVYVTSKKETKSLRCKR